MLFGSVDREVVLLSSVSCWAKQRTENLSYYPVFLVGPNKELKTCLTIKCFLLGQTKNWKFVLQSSVSCWAKQRTECERVPSAFLLNSTCNCLHIYTSKYYLMLLPPLTFEGQLSVTCKYSLYSILGKDQVIGVLLFSRNLCFYQFCLHFVFCIIIISDVKSWL